MGLHSQSWISYLLIKCDLAQFTNLTKPQIIRLENGNDNHFIVFYMYFIVLF